MRTYAMILVLISVIFGCEAFGMGKGEGPAADEKALKEAPPATVLPAECAKAKPICVEVAKVEAKPSCVEAKPEAVAPIEASTSAPKPQEAKPEAAAPAEASISTAVAAQPQEAKPDNVLATVNGTAITQGQVDAFMKPQLEQMKAMGRTMPESVMKMAVTQTVEMLITKQLLEQKLEAKKIEISDEDIDAKISEIAKMSNATVDDITANLAKNGVSLSEFRSEIKLGVGVEKLMETEGGETLAVTDEEAKKHYDENPQEFTSKETVKVSHILAGGRGIDEQGKIEAKAKIEEVQKKLKEGGNFEELASEYSACPSGKKGGDLEVYFDETGRMAGSRGGMDPIFSKAAFALKTGEISDIVETPFGYHIIKLTDRKGGETKTFEEVTPNLVKRLELQKKENFWKEYQAELIAGAKIEWSEELKPQEEPIQLELNKDAVELSPEATPKEDAE